ncbi:hypothetical protein TNCV_4373271 [Trichonephila clavipes]|uniref:Uncharacterized protein n=1 Tax=Trichonephila clavipes TaxID=2585209 RepID=A0A8X6R8K7_TRICX|nr:hypothetical protein TNCV_4373271 [Trichonephila clavipes]
MRSPSSIRRLFFGRLDCNTVLNPLSGSFDVGLGESGALHSALWHGGDWLVDGIREAWQTCFIRMEDVQSFLGA